MFYKYLLIISCLSISNVILVTKFKFSSLDRRGQAYLNNLKTDHKGYITLHMGRLFCRNYSYLTFHIFSGKEVLFREWKTYPRFYLSTTALKIHKSRHRNHNHMRQSIIQKISPIIDWGKRKTDKNWRHPVGNRRIQWKKFLIKVFLFCEECSKTTSLGLNSNLCDVPYKNHRRNRVFGLKDVFYEQSHMECK